MGFSNERMRTGLLVNWFLLDGLELTPAGNPVTKALPLPFGVDHLIGFNELLTCKHPENAGVHFFLDDYQFERFWRQPQRYLDALAKFPLVLGPTFSMYLDFPEPMQRWNHYRNQFLVAWLQSKGVCAIQTPGWAAPDSYGWCFDGISKGGAVAVSSLGNLCSQHHKRRFQARLCRHAGRLRTGGDSVLWQGTAGHRSAAPGAGHSVAGIPAPDGRAAPGSEIPSKYNRGEQRMGDTGGSYSGSQGVKSTKAAKIAAVVQAAPQPQAGPPTGANGFGHLTPQQVSAMESAAQRQMMRDPALAAGVTDYINPVMQSNGKALSQNANWAAATGQPLTKRQQQMLDAVDKLAKPIGQETTLYRADHPDFLERHCGLPSNYSSMSDSQLRKLLVGSTWQNSSLESTAYDSRNNPFWPQAGGRGTGTHGQGGIRSGNREILIRYHTAKSARAAFIQPSQSEAVLAVGTHHKITGVRSTRLGPSRTYLSGKKVLELEIEVW